MEGAGYREILEMPTWLPKERQWRVLSPRLHVLLTQASVCLLSSLRTKRVSVYVFAISSDKRDCVVLGDCPNQYHALMGQTKKVYERCALAIWSGATRGRWLIYCAAVHVRRLAPVFFWHIVVFCEEKLQQTCTLNVD